MAATSDITTVSTGQLTFLIMNAPTDKNIYSYCKQLKSQNVSIIVRVCEPTYSAEHCGEFQIEVKDHPFSDGAAPPVDVIKNWLDIVQEEKEKGKAIAVHCVAGLGRAPLLVAIALIEFANMEPLEAVQKVRAERRGAINRKQLQYLTSYQPTRTQKETRVCCCVM